MKTTPSNKILVSGIFCAQAVLIIALVALGLINLEASGRPTGSLDAAEEFVVAGQHANLKWDIKYPVQLDHNDNPINDATMNVRLIASAINPRHKIRFGATFNGGSMETLYHGRGELSSDYSIVPGQIVRSLPVKGGTDVEFHARIELYSWWNLPWISTNSTDRSHMIERLRDGDTVPNYKPVPGQSSVAELLASYSKGGKIDIGPNDVIIILEAYTSNIHHPDYDMQDMIVLISYE